MGLLMFDGGAFSFSDIAADLKISRGSVSTNVRKLMDRGVIRKTAKSGDRQDYFVFADNPYQSLMSGVSARATVTAQWLKKIADKLGDDNPDRLQRVQDHAAFYKAIATGFRPK